MMPTLRRGQQIAYVPPHAQTRNGPSGPNKHYRTWDAEHPDVEYGFVMSDAEHHAFCRFWVKGQLGVLRTTANSERTPKWCLIEYDSVDQAVVDKILATL